MEGQNQSRPFRRIAVCIPNVNNDRQDVIILALDPQINTIKPCLHMVTVLWLIKNQGAPPKSSNLI